ncbi:nuclear transport factor 2 family protein [Streptomyces sp. NPDC059866]|uniref:nuclear transport factor 2 family protein n=1 Tax=Streptomyces sp. NPDC059866 TaxID=3346978 RepID=UPI00365F3B22
MRKTISFSAAVTLLADGSPAMANTSALAEEPTTALRPATGAAGTTDIAALSPSVDRTSRTNAKVLRGFYATFARGDIEAAKKFVTADFVMHVPGNGKNADEYWDPDGLATFMNNILAWNGGRFAIRVPHAAVNGDGGFTREIIDLNRKHDPERTWQLRFTMHYAFKAGKVSEAWTMPEDQRHYDAYWTAPTGGRAASDAATPGTAAAPRASEPARLRSSST